MNFLITGAAGFLGSSLANQLAREGHQVRGLDDLSTGNPQALSTDVHFTRGDVSDRPKLWTLAPGSGCGLPSGGARSVPESVLSSANRSRALLNQDGREGHGDDAAVDRTRSQG